MAKKLNIQSFEIEETPIFDGSDFTATVTFEENDEIFLKVDTSDDEVAVYDSYSADEEKLYDVWNAKEWIEDIKEYVEMHFEEEIREMEQDSIDNRRYEQADLLHDLAKV